MTGTPDNPTTATPDDFGLRKVLNSHGHGFQYAALKQCLATSWWRCAVAEYPVELNGKSVHIDFVLVHGTHLVVAECKRVEGWRWGFARGYSEARGRNARMPRADYLSWSTGARRLLGRDTRAFSWYSQPYDVAVELKQHDRDGKKEAKSPRAFDDALTQVLRARGGLIEDLCHREGLRYGGGAVIPVIFTTAPLVATDTELHEADISTGKFNQIGASTSEFLWLDHSLSRDLRPTVHTIPRGSGTPTKTEAMREVQDYDMIRSIAIVNSVSIAKFLIGLSEFLDSGSHQIYV